ISPGTGSGPDVIQFAPSLLGQTINLSVAQDTAFGPTALDINSPVTIVGPTGGVTISRAASVNNLRLFEVLRSGQLTLQNLTLSQGQALGGNGADGIDGGGGGGGGAGLGGAVLNFGALTVQSSTLSGNVARGGSGGGDTAPIPGAEGGKIQINLEVGGAGGGTNGAQATRNGGFAGGGGGGSGGYNGGNGGLGGGGGSNGSPIAAGTTQPGLGGFAGGNAADSKNAVI